MADFNADVRPVPDPTILTTEQLHREIAALREYVDTTKEHLAELSQERVGYIERRFDLLEKLRLEQKTDTRTGVDAALAAAKEAASTSEKSITRQLDGLTATFNASMKGQTEIMADVKERVSKLEVIVMNNATTAATAVASHQTTSEAGKAGTKEAYLGITAIIGVVVSALIVINIVEFSIL